MPLPSPANSPISINNLDVQSEQARDRTGLQNSFPTLHYLFCTLFSPLRIFRTTVLRLQILPNNPPASADDPIDCSAASANPSLDGPASTGLLYDSPISAHLLHDSLAFTKILLDSPISANLSSKTLLGGGVESFL
jgi:hypothetical protein